MTLVNHTIHEKIMFVFVLAIQERACSRLKPTDSEKPITSAPTSWFVLYTKNARDWNPGLTSWLRLRCERLEEGFREVGSRVLGLLGFTSTATPPNQKTSLDIPHACFRVLVCEMLPTHSKAGQNLQMLEGNPYKPPTKQTYTTPEIRIALYNALSKAL